MTNLTTMEMKEIMGGVLVSRDCTDVLPSGCIVCVSRIENDAGWCDWSSRYCPDGSGGEIWVDCDLW